MDRAEKQALIAGLRERLGTAAVLIVTRQVGLTVAQSQELRRDMRQAGASYRVTKNRLAKIALEGTKFEGLAPYFIGPTAITIADDPVAAAKVCVAFAKKNDKLSIVGGGLPGQVLDLQQVEALATLPSLDQLRGKIIGLVQAPATKLAGVIQAPAGQLARVLQAYASEDEAA